MVGYLAREPQLMPSIFREFEILIVPINTNLVTAWSNMGSVLILRSLSFNCHPITTNQKLRTDSPVYI